MENMKAFFLLIAFLCLVHAQSNTSCFSSYPSTAVDPPANTAKYTDLPLELGTKFTTAVDGTVLSVITYGYAGDTTQFVGKIWNTSSTANPICTTAPVSVKGGFQTIDFENCRINAGTTYVVSVNYDNDKNGGYLGDTTGNYFLGGAITSGDLTIIDAQYSTVQGHFPDQTFKHVYYWQGLNFVHFFLFLSFSLFIKTNSMKNKVERCL